MKRILLKTCLIHKERERDLKLFYIFSLEVRIVLNFNIKLRIVLSMCNKDINCTSSLPSKKNFNLRGNNNGIYEGFAPLTFPLLKIEPNISN